MTKLFFRVVSARYKEKEYTYLKLLESHRQGDKIKHKQLISLPGVNQMPADRIKPLFEDLAGSLALYREISESLPLSCRQLKASYLVALENSFKIPENFRTREIREMLDERKTKHSNPDNNLFFGFIFKYVSRYGITPDSFCWVENIADPGNNEAVPVCYLLNGSGFPLKFTPLSGPEGVNDQETRDTQIKNIKPQFFLAPTCERLYNTMQQAGLTGEEKGFTFKEIFVFKQLTDWPGTPDYTMEKLFLCGPEAALGEDTVNRALQVVIDFKSHQAYIDNRIGMAGRKNLPSGRDLICTYFTSFFFKKLLDSIAGRYNI